MCLNPCVDIDPTIDRGFGHNGHNDIDAMTQARNECINLQHTFEEFVRFIRRNDEVAEAFRACIAADPHVLEEFQEYQHLVPA